LVFELNPENIDKREEIQNSCFENNQK